MSKYTKLHNLEVLGKLKASGGVDNLGLTKSTYQITATDAAEAAGSTPTATEFNAVVTLVNELKTDYNKLINALSK